MSCLIMLQSVSTLLDSNSKISPHLVPGECVNILKSYCKVRHIVEFLGHSAFILEFYIAFDIILICLIGDCFINKLKLRDPFKSLEKVPSIRL